MTTKAAKNILVVDDDPDILLQIGTILKQDGYTVRSAATAKEAEGLIVSQRPDLAIIDLMMEEKDSGFLLCRRIKKSHPGTPVIMLTAVKAATGLSFASVLAEDRSWMQADVLMDKPVRPERLRADVSKFLGGTAEAKSDKQHH